MSTARYGAYDGGPDPLAPPLDGNAVLDELARDVLDGGSPEQALRELMRRGLPMRGGKTSMGLDELRRRAQQAAERLRRRTRLDGLLDEVAELLDRAVTAERAELDQRAAAGGDQADDAAFRQQMIEDLPDSTAAAVQALADYDWRSPAAAQAYAELRELLRREVLEAQQRGLSQAMQAAASDPQALAQAQQRLAQMAGELADMLEKQARGEDVSEQFEKFLDDYADLFPDRPGSLDELVEDLARRQAAMQRLLDSLPPDQRAELAQLAAQAFDDPDLEAAMDRLSDQLRAARPDLFAKQGRQRGSGKRGKGGQRGQELFGYGENADDEMGLADAIDSLSELSALEELSSAMDGVSGENPGASMADLDPEQIAELLGREAGDSAAALAAAERALAEQGLTQRVRGELELTPKGVRRLGLAALRQVFSDLEGLTPGGHDVRDAGSAGELTGTSRQWQFGDEQPLDVIGTVRNAVLRQGTSGSGTSGSGSGSTGTGIGRVKLNVDDFVVQETERRSRAAVVLMVDLSWSMVLNDTWGAAKTTALALHTLASSMFPQDALLLIGFSDYARVLQPTELAGMEGAQVQGTNLHHALMLAGRFLDKNRDAEPLVLIVTDGEPTAHLLEDGTAWFDWPSSPQTIAATLQQVDRMTRRGAILNVFALGDDPRLLDFLDGVARRNGGRVLRPDNGQLGQYVVSDYLRRRNQAGRGRRAS